MKISKVSMAIVAAAGLLAVCPSVNAQGNNRMTNAPAGGRGRGQTVDARLAQIDTAVTLTEAEKPKVKAALEAENTALQEARNAPAEERRTKTQAARDETTKKMKEILTPEQFTKFQAIPQTGGRRGNRGGGAGGGGAQQ
jgi:protein CpxP